MMNHADVSPTIEIHPRGGPELDPYVQELADLRPELARNGVQLSEIRTRAIDPISTLVVSIVGAVATRLVLKCVDTLLERAKKHPEPTINITLIYQERSYRLPEERNTLESLAERGIQNSD